MWARQGVDLGNLIGGMNVALALGMWIEIVFLFSVYHQIRGGFIVN